MHTVGTLPLYRKCYRCNTSNLAYEVIGGIAQGYQYTNKRNLLIKESRKLQKEIELRRIYPSGFFADPLPSINV